MKKVKVILTAMVITLITMQITTAQEGKEMIGKEYDYTDVEVCYDYNENDIDFGVVEYKGKFGIVDKALTVVIPIIYDEINEWVVDELFEVYKDGKLGFLDKNANVVIPFIYDQKTLRMPYSNKYKQRVIIVKKGRKWGLLSMKGKVLVKFKYADYWHVKI